MHKALKISIPVLLMLGVFLLWKITRNQQDPTWLTIKNLKLSEIETLEKSPNKLQLLFERFHGKETSDSTNAIKLIDEPYVPIMEYSKFEKYIEALQKEKRILISTVEGGGSTTLVSRLAKFIAIEDARILNVKCSPQFDLIYHKNYIGEVKDGKYVKGELLLFWEECVLRPDKKFIAVFDDFDKINPETLFGPDLWENLNNKKYKKFVAGEEVVIPDNFYMISTTLSAIGSRIQLHNEHFKRIGHNYYLKPNTIDLALYLERSRTALDTKISKEGSTALSDKEKKQIKALRDPKNVLEYLYLFEKTNHTIEKDISKTSQLAQWSEIRKLYLPEDRDKLIETFISHVNAISPEKKFDRTNFEPIFYTFKNKGLMQGSSSLATSFKVFKEWGFLTEFVVAICFALATALISVYLNSKRKRKVTKFLTRSEEIYMGFENRTMGTDMAINKLSELKLEIEEHTKGNKISFPEAIFFYNSVRSKVNSIEITKNINATFLILMDIFLDDEELSENEYNKLIAFLHKIEHTIPKNDFDSMKEQVHRAWEEFGEEQ